MNRKEITLTLRKLHPVQRQVKREARRFNTLALGRRSGKTTLGVDMLIDTALAGRPAGWFAPSYKLLLEAWRETNRLLHPIITRRSEQERRLELMTDGVIEFWTLDDPKGVARGRKYQRAIIDEAALVRHLEEAWQESIRPTLIDYAGDAWFLSTPRGFDFFRTLWQRGNPENPLRDPQYQSWQMPTTCNPYLPPQEIEEAKRELTERAYRQEILAEFLSDGGGVFRYVDKAATAKPQESAIPHERGQPRHSYVFGLDWGRSQDFTAVAVIDELTKECVALDRFSQLDYANQRNKIKGLYEQFHPHTILAESNSIGQPNIEMLHRDNLPVVPFVTTNASKAVAVETLQLAFEQGELKILPNPVLIQELLAFQSERLPNGLMRYAAPEGMHDDTVIALALAWQCASQPKTRVSELRL